MLDEHGMRLSLSTSGSGLVPGTAAANALAAAKDIDE
jgi:hypothetical protein